MSTRAHIRIKDGDEQIMLYHHHDGYPEGVGRDLKKFLSEKCKNWWDAPFADSIVPERECTIPEPEKEEGKA